MNLGRFHGYLLLHPEGPRYFRIRQILEPFEYITSWGHKLRPVDNMKTDLGSIPRPIWWVPGFSRDQYSRSYTIHDFLYWLRLFPRWFCDYLLLECLLVEILENMLAWPRWFRPFYCAYHIPMACVVFLFVRIFGWWPWILKGRRRRNKVRFGG